MAHSCLVLLPPPLVLFHSASDVTAFLGACERTKSSNIWVSVAGKKDRTYDRSVIVHAKTASYSSTGHHQQNLVQVMRGIILVCTRPCRLSLARYIRIFVTTREPQKLKEGHPHTIRREFWTFFITGILRLWLSLYPLRQRWEEQNIIVAAAASSPYVCINHSSTTLNMSDSQDKSQHANFFSVCLKAKVCHRKSRTDDLEADLSDVTSVDALSKCEPGSTKPRLTKDLLHFESASEKSCKPRLSLLHSWKEDARRNTLFQLRKQSLPQELRKAWYIFLLKAHGCCRDQDQQK